MFVMGLDIGYSNLKVAMGAPGSPPTVMLHPAGAAPVDRLPETLRTGEAGVQVVIDGAWWAAGVAPGKFALWNRVLHEDYAGSASYRALFHGALLGSEQDRVETLVTGLPVSRWLDRQHRDTLAQRLTGTHQVTRRRAVTVESVQVIPQPLGAYLDLLWSGQSGDVLEDGRVLVVDPGFFSVDWVVVDRGELRKGSSGTSLEAMSVVLAEASRLITADHGGRVTVDRIEEALRANRTQVLLFGQPVVLAPYLAQAATKVAAVALDALRESIRKEAGSLDLVLLTGGGAACYRPAAEALFPTCRVVVPPEPERANARGFFYYGSG
jgi:plasmid segregation protein ParM